MKSGFTKTLRMPLVAAFAIAAFPALAADLSAPYKGGAPAYMMPSTWTGFYLGVNGGYGWADHSSRLDAWAFETGDEVPLSNSGKFSPEGAFGGAQIGYNVQRDRIVFGIEADFQGADIGKSATILALSTDQDIATIATAQSTLEWFGTVRGRLGYTLGSTLVYATGGLAYGSAKDSLSQTVNAVAGADPKSSTSTLTGYVVGGGVEVAVSPSWSVKAEYQYIDLGSTTLSTFDTVTYGNGASSAKFDHIYHTARVGLNYKIAPVYEPLK